MKELIKTVMGLKNISDIEATTIVLQVIRLAEENIRHELMDKVFINNPEMPPSQIDMYVHEFIEYKK